jgi:hypothetical protein
MYRLRGGAALRQMPSLRREHKVPDDISLKGERVRSDTYKELFNESLEESISAGGDVGTIVTLVNAYQNHDVIAHHFAFMDWINDESFTCTLYGKAFKVARDEVEESDYVVCPKCRRKN